MKTEDVVKQIRSKIGMTQAQLANQLSISDKAVSAYEMGNRTPSVSVGRKLIKVARYRGIKKKNGQPFVLHDLYPEE
jgi:DNA-binding XRE family transcriptional regulator